MAPPGVAGTTILIERVGYACALACSVPSESATVAAIAVKPNAVRITRSCPFTDY